MSEFKREERYFVIKRSHILKNYNFDNESAALRNTAIRRLEDQLRTFITRQLDADTIECVVVERDWPEYETVWGLIQDRVEGRQNIIERLTARVEELESERDELANFFRKHALGPMLMPSCLVCGKIAIEPVIQHAELPGIVVCGKCRDAALSQEKDHG